MKITLTTLLLSAFVLVGCADDSSILSSPETQITHQSTSPNWVKLPTDLGQGFGIETEYSASELIEGEDGGVIELMVKIKRHGNPLGDFEVRAKIRVQENSFPAEEYRTFTVSLDPEYFILNITPSPSTLDKQLVIDLFVKGIDASQVNPDTFGFIFVGDNSEILETESEDLRFSSHNNWFKVKKAEIIVPTNQTPDGARYGFTR